MIIGQVNSYPGVRGFTAIGTGGDDFVQSMVVAVESVIQQPIPEVIVFSFHRVYLSLHSAVICGALRVWNFLEIEINACR